MRRLRMSLGSVKIYVGVTDLDWFEFLSTRSLDEVNFWQPAHYGI